MFGVSFNVQLKVLKMSLFADCGFATLVDIARFVTLQSFGRGEKVIVEGDPGETLVIIATGCCSVWKGKPAEKAKPDFGKVVDLNPAILNPPSDEIQKAAAYFGRASIIFAAKQDEITSSSLNVVGNFILGNIFAEGSSFGELSILCESSRQASVVVESHYANFLMMTREQWNTLLRVHQQRILAEKVEFFAPIKFFSKWSNNRLLMMLGKVKERKFGRDMPIFRHGDVAKSVYRVLLYLFFVCFRLSDDIVR